MDIIVALWPLVEPLVVLFLTVIAPVIVTWLSVKLAGLMNIQNEAARAALEAQIRDALHKSAENAIKAAGAGGMTAAIEYVKTKNPDAVAKFGLDDRGIAAILKSKAG